MDYSVATIDRETASSGRIPRPERQSAKPWRRSITPRLTLSLLALLCLPLAGRQAVASDLVGWGAVEALGLPSTTGGGDGPVYIAKTFAELAQYAALEDACTIKVMGELTGQGAIRVRSDKSIIGLGASARLNGFGLNVSNQSNVVIRNLTISGAVDGIAVLNSHHVWVDHCDLSACGDGLLDLTHQADFVTVSWTRFSKHHKTSLVNSGTSEPRDVGKLNTTFHHCWWDGSDTRNPRVGYGMVHVFNCLYNGNQYCIGTHSQARVLAERNYFNQTRDVIFEDYVFDTESPFYGNCEERDNIFVECSGRKDDDGISFPVGEYYLYDFAMGPAAGVPEIVKAGVGPHARHGEAVVLPAPGDGAINVRTRPRLDWTRGERAVSYKVHFGQSNPPEFRIDAKSRSFSPGVLEPGTLYYWRVDQVTSTTTLPGELWRFRTLPKTASFPHPANNQPAITPGLNLSWRAGADTVAHNVHFGTKNPPAPAGRQTDSRFTPPALDYDTTYYWRVDEVTSHGTTAGDVWSFHTKKRVLAGPGKVESEDAMRNDGYYAETYEGASGGKLAAIDGMNGSVQYWHQGAEGPYDIAVTYLDETDGASPFRLFVGDRLIGQWSAGENPAGDGYRTRTFPAVPIGREELIRVVGSRQRGSLARIDYIVTTPAVAAATP